MFNVHDYVNIPATIFSKESLLEIKMVDLVGQRFNMLLVKEYAYTKKKYFHYWLCACDCGNSRIVEGAKLRQKRTQSCGCLHWENVKRSTTKHNLSETKIYRLWNGARDRCHNSNSVSYRSYGGRGIRMFESWRHDFLAFYNYVSALDKFDLYMSTEKIYQLDRIDNDGNYEPGNLRWVTQLENQNNTQKTRFVTYRGTKMPIRDFYRRFCYHLKWTTALARINRGWDLDDVINLPLKRIG